MIVRPDDSGVQIQCPRVQSAMFQLQAMTLIDVDRNAQTHLWSRHPCRGFVSYLVKRSSLWPSPSPTVLVAPQQSFFGLRLTAFVSSASAKPR